MAETVLYTVKTHDGLEIGPIPLEKVIALAQEGQFSSTSMIFKNDTRRWHLAASLPEIRVILRKHNPRHDSHISRLRRHANIEARDSRQFSFKAVIPTSVYPAIKKMGLLYKIFPFLKRK